MLLSDTNLEEDNLQPLNCNNTSLESGNPLFPKKDQTVTSKHISLEGGNPHSSRTQ